MGNVLKVKDKKTNKWIDIPAIQGRSAYEAAVDSGFEGTEEEFAKALTGVALDGEHITNTNNPHKVTADQIDALPITGGTMTGKLRVPEFGLTNAGVALEVGRYIDFHDEDMSGDYDIRLAVGHNKQQLLFRRPNDENYHRMYGEHFKPTAADVGAIAETIGIDGKDILGIVDDGWYFSINSKNVPTESTFGYVLVRTSTDTNNYRVVYWRPADLTTEYVNMLINGKWSGWTETFTNKGGALTGLLEFINDNDYYAIKKHRKANDIDHMLTLGVGANGSTVLENYTDNVMKARLELDENGLKFGKGTTYPMQSLFGEHNKPTQTYNGSSNAQTIKIGGVGNAVIITGHNPDKNYSCGGIVTSFGGFILFIDVSSHTVDIVKSTVCKYENGNLTFFNNHWLNQLGFTYTVCVI